MNLETVVGRKESRYYLHLAHLGYHSWPSLLGSGPGLVLRHAPFHSIDLISCVFDAKKNNPEASPACEVGTETNSFFPLGLGWFSFWVRWK